MNTDSGCSAIAILGPIGIIFLVGGILLHLEGIGAIVFALCFIAIVLAFFSKEGVDRTE